MEGTKHNGRNAIAPQLVSSSRTLHRERVGSYGGLITSRVLPVSPLLPAPLPPSSDDALCPHARSVPDIAKRQRGRGQIDLRLLEFFSGSTIRRISTGHRVATSARAVPGIA
eukprot:1298371-Rhodomonas_salina.5